MGNKLKNLILIAALALIATIATAEDRVISQDVAQGEEITSMQFELQINGGVINPMTNIVVAAGVTNLSFVWDFTPGSEYRIRTIAQNLAGDSVASDLVSAGSIPSKPAAPTIAVP